MAAMEAVRLVRSIIYFEGKAKGISLEIGYRL